jgi:heme exporter protein D
MGHQNFIIAAFAVTALGMAWLTVSSYLAMKQSEALADDLRQQP